MKINTGGGTFDPEEKNLYFIASSTGTMSEGYLHHTHILVAVNELTTDKSVKAIVKWMKEGRKVFIDSGVYNLAVEHAKKNDVSMDVALNLPVEQIDGFDKLYERYIYIIEEYGELAWGYIEIDLGGRLQKIQTRSKLHELGLNPIPVYHPLSDGWDYFDYLCANYDRICFGNMVMADRQTRKRLLATMWERHRRYPDVWIHILGLTPNEWCNAYPPNSADSSSWLSAIRWAGMEEKACGKTIGFMQKNFQYKLGSDPESSLGRKKAVAAAAQAAHILQRNWQNYMNAMNELGFDIYPEILGEEK